MTELQLNMFRNIIFNKKNLPKWVPKRPFFSVEEAIDHLLNNVAKNIDDDAYTLNLLYQLNSLVISRVGNNRHTRPYNFSDKESI